MAAEQKHFTAYAEKQGGGTTFLFGKKNWKKRYFVVNYEDKTLSYFETESQFKPGAIALKPAIKIELGVVSVTEEATKDHNVDYYHLVIKPGAGDRTEIPLRFPSAAERKAFAGALGKVGLSLPAGYAAASTPAAGVPAPAATGAGAQATPAKDEAQPPPPSDASTLPPDAPHNPPGPPPAPPRAGVDAPPAPPVPSATPVTPPAPAPAPAPAAPAPEPAPAPPAPSAPAPPPPAPPAPAAPAPEPAAAAPEPAAAEPEPHVPSVPKPTPPSEVVEEEPPKPAEPELPEGWTSGTTAEGYVYYVSPSGASQWDRPT